MAIIDKLAAWLAGSVQEIPVYECTDCGHTIGSEPSNCPECGDEEAEIAERWVPMYWDGMG